MATIHTSGCEVFKEELRCWHEDIESNSVQHGALQLLDLVPSVGIAAATQQVVYLRWVDLFL